METFKKVARWHENPLATAEDLARKADHDSRSPRRRRRSRPDRAANERLQAGARPESPAEDAEPLYPPRPRPS